MRVNAEYLREKAEKEERERKEEEEAIRDMVARWLYPNFKIVCVWPFRLLDYGSATLRCKI